MRAAGACIAASGSNACSPRNGRRPRAPARPHAWGNVVDADRLPIGTARMERTPRGRMGHVGWRAFDWLRGNIRQVRARMAFISRACRDAQDRRRGFRWELARQCARRTSPRRGRTSPRRHPRSCVMSKDAHPVVALQVAQQRQDLSLDRHVERGCRLVGDQQLRTR